LNPTTRETARNDRGTTLANEDEERRLAEFEVTTMNSKNRENMKKKKNATASISRLYEFRNAECVQKCYENFNEEEN